MRKQLSGSAFAALWRKMFSSYLIIISLSFLLYSAAVVGESYLSLQKVEEEQGQLYAGAVASLVDEQILTTKSLSTGIDVLTDFKDLYFSQFTDRQLSAFQGYLIRKALSQIRASAKYQNMPQIAVFINGKKEVFTHDDMRLLSRPFSGAAAGESFSYGTLSELLELPDEDAGKFRETGFVCMVPYSYTGEDTSGTPCTMRRGFSAMWRNCWAARPTR